MRDYRKNPRGVTKVTSLIHPVLANVKKVAAQTQEDAERFIAIGAKPGQVIVVAISNSTLKYLNIILKGKQLKSAFLAVGLFGLPPAHIKGKNRFFWMSTSNSKLKIPELLLLIVPRHPERFAEVSTLCNQNNLVVVTRTSKQPCNLDTDVYLADTMGELKMLYAAADVAFVGGSMVSVGGHNLLEASAIGVPVLFGPYMANFKEIALKVFANKAAIQCHDKAAISTAIQSVYSDTCYRNLLIDNGKLFVQLNRGAIDKLCEMLSYDLDIA